MLSRLTLDPIQYDIGYENITQDLPKLSMLLYLYLKR